MASSYMDLINMAEQNSRSKQLELERRKAEAVKERKLDAKQVKLKVGVQKFLAKKEEEERQKKEIENRKMKQLLELRNQDKKANSRVRRMITMTKSANKSVLAEATDSLSDQCNAQAMANEAQPDEDDYGYTSSFATEMYKKMLDKYKTEAKKAPLNISSSKTDKIQSLKTSTSKGSGGKDVHQPETIRETIKPKKKPPPPPPPTFSDLLLMAEEKSKEPILLKLPEVVKGPEHYEFGRPMTAKEKKKYLDEMDLKRRAEAAFSNNQPSYKSNTSTSSNSKAQEADKMKPKDNPIPKVKSLPSKFDDSRSHKFKDPPLQSVSAKRTEMDSKRRSEAAFSNNHISKETSYKSNTSTSSTSKTQEVERRKPKDNPLPKDNHLPKVKSLPSKFDDSRSHKFKQPPQPSASAKRAEINNNFSKSPLHKSNSNMEPLRHSKNTFTNLEPRRKDINIKRRAVIESDEEYDSEMDDFIDDSGVSNEEISSLIGNMFGYNKRKYANENSDDECMESSVEQQMREEERSYRLGLKEDLEDIKMEEEEKRKKALMAKKRKMK